MDHVQAYADVPVLVPRRPPPRLVGRRALAFNGDMTATDDSVRHSPVADAGENCIGLSLT